MECYFLGVHGERRSISIVTRHCEQKQAINKLVIDDQLDSPQHEPPPSTASVMSAHSTCSSISVKFSLPRLLWPIHSTRFNKMSKSINPQSSCIT